jgi:magnesium transporter
LPGDKPVRVTVIDYGLDHLEEKVIERFEDLLPYRDAPNVTWINVEGLQNVALLEALGQHFGIHALTLEDILNCGQRPKLEDYGTYHFLVMKSLALHEGRSASSWGRTTSSPFRRSPATPSRRSASASAAARG